MQVRWKTLAAVSALLASAGCSVRREARVSKPFQPPAPASAAAVALEPPPEVPASAVAAPMPGFVLASLQLPTRLSRAEIAVQQATQAYQRGRTLYQAHNISGARGEFDAAIDLLLEASDEDPVDRPDLERRIDEMADEIHRFDLAGLGAAAEVDEGKFEKAPLEDILEMTFPVDPRLKDKVQEQVAATVSQLPLTVNDTVLGYINYFMNRGHKTVVAAMERSGRYRPMIQRILDEEGLPQELIHLAQAESGFIPRAMSRKAAGGMWQFVKFRGNEYGLRQTPYTDDRMDPEMATRAAAHHLHDLYSEFGDWYLAIAAYNCGPNVVEGAVGRTGYADFWELRDRGVLPAETTNYVPIILAMTIMEKNAKEYGLDGIQMDPPLEYDTVEMTANTGMTLVADIADIPLAEVAALNPAILKGVVPSGYSLRVPKGMGNPLLAALQQVPADHRDAWRMHRVGTGETLADIGKRYGVSAASLVAANNLRPAEATEGDRLLIPAARRSETPTRRAAARTPAGVAGTTAALRPKPVSKHRKSSKPGAKAAVAIARTTGQ